MGSVSPSSSQPGPADTGSSVAYRIVRAMFVVVFFWAFWKFGGFLLNALVGRLYKATAESDAYFFAAQVVVYGLIFSPVLKILVPAFVPVFIEERNSRGERAAWKFAGNVFHLTLVVCAGIMLAVYLYAEPITDTLVGGFSPGARVLGVRLLKWLMPGAVLMVLYLPVRSILNSYKVFSYPSAAEATQKLIWAVGLYVTYRYLHLGVMAVAAGFLVGSAGMAAVALFGMRGRIHLYRPLSALSGQGAGRALGWGTRLLGVVAFLAAVVSILPQHQPYRLAVAVLLSWSITVAVAARARGQSRWRMALVVLAVGGLSLLHRFFPQLFVYGDVLVYASALFVVMILAPQVLRWAVPIALAWPAFGAAFRALPAGVARTDVSYLTIALLAALALAGGVWMWSRHKSSPMARFAALAAPLLLGTTFAAYRDVITFYFQSFTARGVFSDIEYARRIAFVPTTMVAYALGVAMFPFLCELASRRNRAELGQVVTRALRLLAVGFVPLTVMTIILSGPVSRLILDRGDWPQVHLHYTSLALALLAVGLIMYAWEYVIMQSFFSLQRMWTPSLMGVAATGFQFAFLAVPIYLLRYDYPAHIFFLVALAYPVSRFFKNLILLGLLRRHVPILPGRETVLFLGKLAVLSAAVGLATYGAYQAVKRLMPYQRYRQHKVVIDSFETGPDTWFSINAREISLAEAPAGRGGLCVRMRYDRHRRPLPSLYREMPALQAAGPMRLEFALHLARGPLGLALEAERPGGRTKLAEWEFHEAQWETWVELSAPIEDPGGIQRLHWREVGPPRGDFKGSLSLDDLRLVSRPTGRLVWSEDFDANGWRLQAGDGAYPGQSLPAVADSAAEGEPARYALALPPGKTVAKAVGEAYDLRGVRRFRCRLRAKGDKTGSVLLTLASASQTARRTLELDPGEWRTVDLSWKDLGFASASGLQKTQRLEIESSASAYLDDVTFRRAPNRMYELYKLLHCLLPTLVGLVVGGGCLVLLRFQELPVVMRWIRRRGWHRSEAELEEATGGGTREP